MKLIWALIAIAAILFVGSLFWYMAVPAMNQSGGDVAITPEGYPGGDVYTAGRNIEVRSGIKGDMAVAGSSVEIAAPVQGYLLAAGSAVNVGGAIGNDLWAAAATVNVGAPVSGNAMLAGSVVNLKPEAGVGRDAYLAGNRVEVHGRVGRNLRVNAADFSLASEVGGSVRARAGKVRLLPGAVIQGDLLAYSPAPPEISPEAKVLGSIQHHPEEGGGGFSLWGRLGWWAFTFLSMFLLGAATIALSARWPNRVADEIATKPGYSLLAGVVGMILIPVIVVLMAITIIGIPLAMVLVALCAAAVLLSLVFVAYVVGGWLLGLLKRPQASPYMRLAAGALAVSLLISLPWIGWLVMLVALTVGFGALILERRDSWRRRHAESLV